MFIQDSNPQSRRWEASNADRAFERLCNAYISEVFFLKKSTTIYPASKEHCSLFNLKLQPYNLNYNQHCRICSS